LDHDRVLRFAPGSPRLDIATAHESEELVAFDQCARIELFGDQFGNG
jgi:hypothetical protein